jgi:hypothetical protein
MALTKVQKELWANGMVALYETMSIGERICNTNLIQDTQADKWHIPAASDVDVSDVDDSTDITYDELTDTETEVTPNFDKKFSVIDYDTNKVQTSIDYAPTYIRRGGYKLINALDAAILSVHAQAGSNFDNAGTDWQFTKSTCAEMPAFFGKLAKAVKDLDWPEAQAKFLIVPSGFKEAILTYTGGRESALGDSDLTQGRSDAFVYGGFNCFISNNLTTVSTTTHGLCGLVGEGIALGKQINPESIEQFRTEGRFALATRGRMKAGYKVYRDTALVDVEINSTVVATS